MSCKAFIQSLRNRDFLTWEGLPFITVYKLLTNNKELTRYEALNQFVSFYVRVISVLADHFVNHVIFVYQRNCHHMTTKMTPRKCFYDEVWPSYGVWCIDM